MFEVKLSTCFTYSVRNSIFLHCVPSHFLSLIHIFYLPHHSVFKGSSITIKLRDVFDGSAKTTNNLSLNDTLMVGPTVQQDLFSIMSRFRTHRYVLISDIEKMYRQILVNPKYSNLQRIVWRDAPHRDCLLYTSRCV